MAINLFWWTARAVPAFAVLIYFSSCCHFATARSRRSNVTLHKVTLSQRDVQFIEFDVDVPPLNEFTFCMWVRTLDDAFEQPLFAYTVDRYREVEVWLEPGGGLVAVSVRGRAAWAPVRALREWRHLCLSWHGAEGAWALYEDATLVACFEDDALVGAVLPKGGRILIGQGNPSRGVSSEVEADIFGFNMIIGSTINSALTIYDRPSNDDQEDRTADSTTPAITREKKPDSFYRKLYRYVVLDKLKERAKKVKKTSHKKKNTQLNGTAYLGMIPPYLMHLKNKSQTESESEFVDITSIQPENVFTSKHQKNIFWNLVKKPGRPEINFDAQSTLHISEYETPPPSEMISSSFISDFETPPSVANDYFLNDMAQKMIFNEALATPEIKVISTTPALSSTLATIETPPPITEQPKVFGQWTSIAFTDSVLNSIRNNNINTRTPQKVVPKTIPLYKISDSFPYTSEHKQTFALPPTNFNHKSRLVPIRQRKLSKRALNRGERNVEIIKEVEAKLISTAPMVSIAAVEISNRGVSEDADNDNILMTDKRELVPEKEFSPDSIKDFSKVYAIDYTTFQPRPKPFQLPESRLKNHNMKGNATIAEVRDDSEQYEAAYAQQHFKGNVWLRPQSKRITSMTSNNKADLYTIKGSEPQAMSTVDFSQIKSPNLEKNNIRQPNNKLFLLDMDKNKNLALPLEIENLEDENLIYIRGKSRRTLPDVSIDEVWSKESGAVPVRLEVKKTQETNEFKKSVKLGNALNEKQIFYLHGDSQKDSFLGSNERVPEINRYRSDLDGVNNGNVPPSLGGKKCRSRGKKLKSRLEYFSDGSVGTQGLASAALRLIESSYKGCSQRKGSVMADSTISLVAWSKTPMRIFGGAEISFTDPPCLAIYIT